MRPCGDLTTLLEPVPDLCTATLHMVDSCREGHVCGDAEAKATRLEHRAHAAHSLDTLACLTSRDRVGLRIGTELPQGRPDVSRGDRIDSNATRCLVNRERLGEGGDSPLGGRIWGADGPRMRGEGCMPRRLHAAWAEQGARLRFGALCAHMWWPSTGQRRQPKKTC